MINIIKTAIITIMISFASGLLLNYFTNLGPRILCNIRNGKPEKMDDKEKFAYIVTVKNPSKKTIHELTVHIQNEQNNLKSTDFKITKGLKFDSNIENNVLEVYIPFLSKGDEFSVTVYLENKDVMTKKPIVVIRSPENFKEIDSSEEKGILLALVNIPKNIEQVMNKVSGTEKTTNRENAEVFSGNSKVSKNKKVIIIIVLFVLIVMAGVSAELYFKGDATNASTNVTKQSTGSKRSGENATKDSGSSASETNSARDAGTNTKGSGTNAATGASSSETTNAATGTSSPETTNSASGAGSSGVGTNETKGAGSSTNTTTPTTNTTPPAAPTPPTTSAPTTSAPTTDTVGAGTNTTTSK